LPEEYGITGGVFLITDLYGTWAAVLVRFSTMISPRTVGVSIFWDTPIGLLWFNYTEPLDVQVNDQTKQFDVTISTDF
jgi:outer membrane protein insertion porin family